MREWLSQLALDVMLMTSFVTESDMQTNLHSDFFKHSRHFIASHGPLQLLLKFIPFRKFVVHLSEICYSYWNPSNFMNVLLALAQTAIRTRQVELKKGVTGRKDLLQLMLTAHESDGVKKMSYEEISAQSLNFLLVSHHATSSTVTSIFYHLSINPDLQERLRRKIETTVQV